MIQKGVYHNFANPRQQNHAV